MSASKNIIVLTLVGLFSLSACEKSTSFGVEDSVTVTLNIGTVEKNPYTKASLDVSQYEGIRTLRVIVTDDNKTQIYKNEKVVLGTDYQNASKYQVSLTDIPKGDLYFYVIANEESIGKEYNSEVLMQNISNSKLLYKDEEYYYFPRKGQDIEDKGIPMSGWTIATVDKNKTNVAIDLERAVTKISFRVENATDGEITLQTVEFGKFFGDRFYVFPEAQLDVPEDAKYKNQSYSEIDLAISARTISDPLSLYLYPTYAYTEGGTDNPYTVAITTDVEYPPQVFAPNVNSFRRNTQINILARITTTAGITLDFNVTDWDSYTVDVPDFK